MLLDVLTLSVDLLFFNKLLSLYFLLPHLKASVGNEAEVRSLAGALDPNPTGGEKNISNL